MNPAVSGRINLYRIVLAFFVIGIHTNYATSQSNGLAFYTSVALDVLYRTAVPGFFVLTGFLILDTADVTWEYSKKRLRKILLPWIVWSAIFLIYRVVALENRISIFSAIRCFLVGDTYYHLWFMYKLVGLYFVAPILGIFVRSAGLTKVATVTLIAYLINIFCVDICRILEFFYPFSFQPAIYMTGIDNFVILAMAGWCSRQIITNPLLKWSTIGTFSLCYVVLVICTMKISLEQSRLIETAYYPSLVTPMAISFFLLMIFYLPYNCNTKWISVLAESSFGIYLIHPLVIHGLEAVEFPLPHEVPLVATTIVFAISALTVMAFKQIPWIRNCV